MYLKLWSEVGLNGNYIEWKLLTLIGMAMFVKISKM
jgi:hypothetical protein